MKPKHWKLQVIDKAIEYYDGCKGYHEGMCTILCNYSPDEYTSPWRMHAEEWYAKYIEMFIPPDFESGYYWDRHSPEGVQCRQIAIRLIRCFVEDDLENEVL